MQDYIKIKFFLLLILASYLSCKPKQRQGVIVGLWVEKSKVSTFEGDTVNVKIPPSSSPTNNRVRELKSYVRFSEKGIYNQLTNTKQIVSRMRYMVENDTLWIDGDKIPIIYLSDKQLIIKESTSYGLITVTSYERVIDK